MAYLLRLRDIRDELVLKNLLYTFYVENPSKLNNIHIINISNSTGTLVILCFINETKNSSRLLIIIDMVSGADWIFVKFDLKVGYNEIRAERA